MTKLRFLQDDLVKSIPKMKYSKLGKNSLPNLPDVAGFGIAKNVLILEVF